MRHPSWSQVRTTGRQGAGAGAGALTGDPSRNEAAGTFFPGEPAGFVLSEYPAGSLLSPITDRPDVPRS